MPRRSRHPKVQHHCPLCGYDLAPAHYPDTFTCPECGEPVERAAAYRAAQINAARLNRKTAALWIVGPPTLAIALLLSTTLDPKADWAGLVVEAYRIGVPLVVFLMPVVILALRARHSPAVRANLPLGLIGAYVTVAGLAYLVGIMIAVAVG